MTCPLCSSLSKRLKVFIREKTGLSAAHLRAVQADDLAAARLLDGPLSEASKGARLYAERLRDHQAAHGHHVRRSPPENDQAGVREERWYSAEVDFY
jgi:hypothetical protein